MLAEGRGLPFRAGVTTAKGLAALPLQKQTARPAEHPDERHVAVLDQP